MFEIKKNKKNKSAVILNPERSEWVSRSHVTSVEIVVNDGAKTKRYSAKRDLYGDFAYAQPLKMTGNSLSLSGASSEPIISAESKENQPRYSVNCQAIPKYDRFYFGFAKILAFAVLFSFNLSQGFAANCVPETTIINGVEKPLVECGASNRMHKYTYDSSGNKTNVSRYKNGLKYNEAIYTYDSSGNLTSLSGYSCDSGICEQRKEAKYKLDIAQDGTKIAKEIYYICSNGVCTKDAYEIVYTYNDDTFTIWNSYGDGEYYCDDPESDYECDTELPQTKSATPFCPKGCNRCDVERACSSCAEGYKKIDTWCNKIRWTPAEAAEVLRDDNTNEVTITFRK